MEILAFLLEFLFELLGQLLFEVVAEFFLRALGQATGYQKPRSPWLAGVGYVLLAGALAMISALVAPRHFIKDPTLRLVNLAVTPLLVGFAMGLRGKVLRKHGKVVIRLETFTYGYLFALVFALVRHAMTR